MSDGQLSQVGGDAEFEAEILEELEQEPEGGASAVAADRTEEGAAAPAEPADTEEIRKQLRERGAALVRANHAAGKMRSERNALQRELADIKAKLETLSSPKGGDDNEELDPGAVLLDIRERLQRLEQGDPEEAKAQAAEQAARDEALGVATEEMSTFLPSVQETWKATPAQARAIVDEAYRFAMGTRHAQLAEAYPDKTDREIQATVMGELEAKIGEWREAGKNPFAEILDFALYHKYAPGILAKRPAQADGDDQPANGKPKNPAAASRVREKIAALDRNNREARALGAGPSGRSGKPADVADLLAAPISASDRNLPGVAGGATFKEAVKAAGSFEGLLRERGSKAIAS